MAVSFGVVGVVWASALAGRSGKRDLALPVGVDGFGPFEPEGPEAGALPVALSSGLRLLNKETPLRDLKVGGSGAASGWLSQPVPCVPATNTT
ncbi:hypothetical protein AA101099_2816 [Neoasaia chiangmaiensis NBRC 101099]|uniref:hypothetical protein n=1 Tax=Neoasaia chiangmaiensis TaxID=320497 RepID=UPI001B7FFBF7|nr:hypothetical protein AA101099_2816 [Neoasaia chiangmaiensis NBRC 101099]